jgi:hypothetical protein
MFGQAIPHYPLERQSEIRHGIQKTEQCKATALKRTLPISRTVLPAISQKVIV